MSPSAALAFHEDGNGATPTDKMSPKAVSGAAAILSALTSAGITHLFVNLGSDHPAFLKAFVSQSHTNLQIFTSPNEMNALSAASGFAQITGRPAAVLVHVESGTLGLAGAIHNVAKGRIPTLILAGTVPVTMAGELLGSRGEYIHWTQDVPDQRGIVRQYMRYEHEIRRPHNAAQIVLRALQYATSSPQGPAYLIASRECLEEEFNPTSGEAQVAHLNSPTHNTAVEQTGLSPAALLTLSDALLASERPLIVTSYAGRSHYGFRSLQRLATIFAIAVHESAPTYNNFPTSNFLHQGHRWNGGAQLPALAEADVVLVVDSDVPWIPAVSRPSAGARIFHLDCDPLKEGMPLWGLPAEGRWRCDSGLALEQLSDEVEMRMSGREDVEKRVDERKVRLKERFAKRTAALEKAERPRADGKVTVPLFMARLREIAKADDLRMVGLNESTTNLPNVADHLGHNNPLTLIGSGGGALGWYSGAAVGAVMAVKEEHKKTGWDDKKEPMVVAFAGDGTWLFGVPSCAYWMAKRYETPFLTIVWNNGGWAAPRLASLRVHPEIAEEASKDRSLADQVYTSITPSPEFGKIAEGAAGAWWTTVREVSEVEKAITEGIRAVREEKRCALIEVVVD